MDFLSLSDNLTELYIYKLKTNKKEINLETDSINFVELEFLGNFEASISSRSKQSILNLDNKVLKLGLADSMSVAISDDFEFKENCFYFLSEKEIENSDDLENCYYFETKVDELIFNDLGNSSINEFTITRLKALKELNNIDFILSKNNNFESYKLELKNSTLINQIMNFQNINENEYFVIPNFEIKNNKKPFLLFANPVAVNEKSYSLFLWSISKFFVKSWDEIFVKLQKINNDTTQQWFLNTITSNNEYKNILKKCSYNTYVELQGSEQQRKEWAAQNGNSKSSDLNDYIIRNFIASKTELEKIEFLSVLLIFSENIASSYSWKGGLNDEHKAVLPLTARFKNIANDLNDENPEILVDTMFFEYYSVTDDFEFGVYNQFINKNVFLVNGKMVQFALTPDEFQEQDLSQQPIDFNNKTLNLNFPFYVFLDKENLKSFLNISENLTSLYNTEILTIEQPTQQYNERTRQVDPLNWYEIVYKKYNTLHPNSQITITSKRDFVKNEIHITENAASGVGATTQRNFEIRYKELEIKIRTLNSDRTKPNNSMFIVNNPNDLNSKISEQPTQIEFQIKPSKVILKGAFLQNYKIIIAENEYEINSKNKITNKIIFWD
ncbi:hypothetical protein AAW50_03515 [Mycoplasmopsis canis]|uniref:DUF295 domain-containing protein n=1 Tax=Mycoplasmopsis canis TaxID=29555 RepID=UPI000624A0A8|nr:DUF295 domain-containing protein [Mycoplasmopsis canis]AKF41028.1 hypothetical protein AAW50_01060 [Mycoplasmopsis canis]AKF41457.1 hypothetical protein AAW50_03515 [Mycoplasmopsis canis]